MIKLARHYLAAWFAMLAISLQILFGMAHLTAMMAVAAGPLVLKNPDSLSYSYLQICTANGLISFENDKAVPDGQNGEDPSKAQDRCPVCSSAATSPFTADSGALPCMGQILPEQHALPQLAQLSGLGEHYREPIRGPPLFS